MRFVSLCSGIEAASVAFGPLGWRAVAFSEIEPFPCELLAYHYPHVPNLGDMTRWREWPERIWIEADAIVAGTPCQAFSVAGNREGLSDARGNLTLIFVDIVNHADRIRRAHGLPPVVILWENVPGALSSADNAFGCLLAGLAGSHGPLVAAGRRPKQPGRAIPWPNAGCVLGPARAVAWRCLDAQYTRLAQRRRRVFVVASARDGFDPGAVLFEFDGVRRDSPPRREAPEDVAGALARCTYSGGAGGRPEGAAVNHFVAHALTGGARGSGGYSYDDVPLVAATLDASFGRLQGCSGQDANHGHSHLVPTAVAAWGGDRASGSAPCVAYGFNARQDPDSWADRVGPLDTDGTTLAVCVTGSVTHTLNTCNGGKGCSEDGTGRGVPTVNRGMRVRRLMPIECERLQGFPDNYTAIPRGRAGKPAADGPRYKALGNSWAIPCVAWIGWRIQRHLT